MQHFSPTSILNRIIWVWEWLVSLKRRVDSQVLLLELPAKVVKSCSAGAGFWKDLWTPWGGLLFRWAGPLWQVKLLEAKWTIFLLPSAIYIISDFRISMVQIRPTNHYRLSTLATLPISRLFKILCAMNEAADIIWYAYMIKEMRV